MRRVHSVVAESLAVRIIATTIWRSTLAVRAKGLRWIQFLERRDNNLGAWLDVLFAQRSGLVLQLIVEIVHDGLSIRCNDSISVVEEQLIDDRLVLDGKLGAHDVLLHFLAEILQSPAGVELDFKFDLLGAGALRIDVGHRVGLVPLLEVAVFDLDCDEKLDSLVVLLLVAGHERRLLRQWVRRPLSLSRLLRL